MKTSGVANESFIVTDLSRDQRGELYYEIWTEGHKVNMSYVLHIEPNIARNCESKAESISGSILEAEQ